MLVYTNMCLFVVQELSFVRLFSESPNFDEYDIVLSLSPPTLLESHIDQLLKQKGHPPLRQLIAIQWMNSMEYDPRAVRYVLCCTVLYVSLRCRSIRWMTLLM